MLAPLPACTESGAASLASAPLAAVAVAAGAARRLAEAPLARYVKLVAESEWNGKAWSAVAEFNVIDSTGATLDRKRWKASADSAEPNDGPGNAIDGNPGSLWHTRWQGAEPALPHELMVDLGAVAKISGFRYLPRQDNSPNGTIARYKFFVSADGVHWNAPVAAGDFKALGPVGGEKTVVFAVQTENHAPVIASTPAQNSAMGQTVHLDIVAQDEDSDTLSYTANGLPPGLTLMPTNGSISGTPIAPGTYSVIVTVTDTKKASSSTAFNWTVQPPARPAALNGPPPSEGEVRFVKLEEVSELNGRPWGSIAEFNLIDAKGATLPRNEWVASADSADVSDLPANAIDGNPGSIWHSQWDGAAPPPPHSFIVDLRRYAKVRGFRYLPRQDKLTNGVIAKYRFYTSIDGIEWGKPVVEGDFTTMAGAPRSERTVTWR